MTRLRATIIGAGLIAAKKHIPAFLRQKGRVELVALCDLNHEATKKVANAFGIPKVYTEISEMLLKEKPELVDICTPPRSHAAIAGQAINAGAHVLIEKPMAITVEECDQIICVSKENGVKVCVGHSDLFYPPFLRARELVSQGAIGDFMGMDIFLSTPTDYMTSKDDHWANKLPGGVIGETGPHAVYMTLAFISPIRDVKAYAFKRLPYPWSAFEDYRITLVGEQGTSTITSIYTTDQWAAQVKIWGTKGMLKLDLELMSLTAYRRDGLTPWRVATSGIRESIQLVRDTVKTGVQVMCRRFKKTHDILVERFTDSILNDTPSPVSAEEGREAVRVMNLIVEQINRQAGQEG